ncbi:ParB/RepB/Spo0J family partition protein [Patescibacteria group bacterium]|nr:ParB/RepB/Spo0J family partition protein [Patescibacteria group bacterium]
MSLGRGIGALIPSKSIRKHSQEVLGKTKENVLLIPINQINPNPNQPRKNFAHSEMEELINSIKKNGIIQPIILTKISSSPDKYEIIAGERRWRSAKFLEMDEVPSLVRSIKNNEKLEISLIENIQRKDLNPMENAVAYQRLIDEFNLTQEQISERIGKSRANIANTLRLLTLPDIIQQAVRDERITEGHAKALLAIKNEQSRKLMLKRILGAGLTVRETAQIAAGNKFRKKITPDRNLLAKEEELSLFLETKVKLQPTVKKVKIIIEAYNNDDLNRIINKIQKHK